METKKTKDTELFERDWGGNATQPGGNYDGKFFAPRSTLSIKNRDTLWLLDIVCVSSILNLEEGARGGGGGR